MTQIQTLKKGDETIYPLTHMKGVVDDNGNTMDVLLAEAEKRALRKLFVAAGAEYNDTGADKTKTAPWGETVTHKAGHYYLNGLGDITEEQMVDIYNAGKISSTKVPFFYDKNNGIKTALKATVRGTSVEKVYMWYSCNTCTNLVVFDCFQGEVGVSSLHAAFINCTKLKHIMTVFNVANVAHSDLAAFGFCSALVNVKLKALTSSLDLKWSPNINKESVLYIIQNATPTKAITITLHANAYTRLADDADVVAALSAQPLITLVSA